MAMNALVKRLAEKYYDYEEEELKDWAQDFDSIFCNESSTTCCGLTEYDGTDRIKGAWTARTVYKHLLYTCFIKSQWSGTHGLLIMTSTTGPKPQLVKLGFKLHKKFVNENSYNTIWMYTILVKDLFPRALLPDEVYERAVTR